MSSDSLRTENATANEHTNVRGREQKSDRGKDKVKGSGVFAFRSTAAGRRLETPGRARKPDRQCKEKRAEVEGAGFTVFTPRGYPRRCNQIERQTAAHEVAAIGSQECRDADTRCRRR